MIGTALFDPRQTFDFPNSAPETGTLPRQVRRYSFKRSIKSWGDAQRQPANPGKVVLRKEDVAEPATKRIKPLCVGPARRSDAKCQSQFLMIFPPAARSRPKESW